MVATSLSNPPCVTDSARAFFGAAGSVFEKKMSATFSVPARPKKRISGAS